jgi:hypothetical protein
MSQNGFKYNYLYYIFSRISIYKMVSSKKKNNKLRISKKKCNLKGGVEYTFDE